MFNGETISIPKKKHIPCSQKETHYLNCRRKIQILNHLESNMSMTKFNQKYGISITTVSDIKSVCGTELDFALLKRFFQKTGTFWVSKALCCTIFFLCNQYHFLFDSIKKTLKKFTPLQNLVFVVRATKRSYLRIVIK